MDNKRICEYNGHEVTASTKLYYCHIQTIPQVLLLPDGTSFTETSPAGRSNVVCSRHLTKTVDMLSQIVYRTYNAKVNVTPM